MHLTKIVTVSRALALAAASFGQKRMNDLRLVPAGRPHLANRDSSNPAVPQRLTYQGVLTNSSGPVPDGSYHFTVRLFDVSSGGAAV